MLDTLGSRYLRFWEPYLADLGVDVATPTLSKRDAYELGRASLPGEAPYVQLALGRILELSQAARVDAVLLPERTSVAGDPWGAAFADVLARRLSSLPALLSVPASGDAAASTATELGVRLTGNPGLVRRALDRRRPLLTPARETMPNLGVASRHTLALVGPEDLLGEPFLLGTLPAELEALSVHAVLSAQVPRDLVAERGLRAGGATPAEREFAGAFQILEGKGPVRGSILAVPASSVAHRTFAEKLAKTAHKPALVLDVSPDRDDWNEVRAFVNRVLLGASSRSASKGDE